MVVPFALLVIHIYHAVEPPESFFCPSLDIVVFSFISMGATILQVAGPLDSRWYSRFTGSVTGSSYPSNR
jgi:hypothetical protein